MVGIMGIVSDVLHRLGTEGAGAQSLCISINTRYFFDDVSIKTGGSPPGPSQQLPVLQDPFHPPTAPDTEPRGIEPVGQAVRPQCTRSGQVSTRKCSPQLESGE